MLGSLLMMLIQPLNYLNVECQKNNIIAQFTCTILQFTCLLALPDSSCSASSNADSKTLMADSVHRQKHYKIKCEIHVETN